MLRLAINALVLGSACALRLFNSGVWPFAQRPWIALLEARVPFKHELIDLKAKPAEFLALSPTGKVPLLHLDDGSIVTESIGVARHVAANHKESADLLPDYAAPLVESFVELWTKRVEPSYYGVLSADSEDGAQFARVGLMESIQAVEDHLWRGAMAASWQEAKAEKACFLLGSQFSLAECVAAPWAERMILMLPYWRGLSVLDLCQQSGCPRTAAWLEAVAARPSVAATSAGEREMARAARQYYVTHVSPGAPGELYVPTEIATFGLGWFHEPQLKFGDIPGVVASKVGYTGGEGEGDPALATAPLTYERVCSRNNSHTEALRLEFDPAVLNYAELVRKFSQDARVQRVQPVADGEPSSLRRPQTRVAVWARDAVQMRTARSILREAGLDDRVPVLPPTAWHEAEEYHQDFLRDEKDFPDWSEGADGGGPGTAWGL